jgi:hypothetical protein
MARDKVIDRLYMKHYRAAKPHGDIPCPPLKHEHLMASKSSIPTAKR